MTPIDIVIRAKLPQHAGGVRGHAREGSHRRLCDAFDAEVSGPAQWRQQPDDVPAAMEYGERKRSGHRYKPMNYITPKPCFC